MILTDESWHLVHNIRGATGFVGSDGKAVPLTEQEIYALGVERREIVVGYAVGDEVKVDVFAVGDKVDITGTSKGHGYTGAIQRWNQHTGPMAHGSKYHRGVGSMGANSDPSRVFKNKHMAGHYGVDRVTIQNLEVVSVDAERNLLLVKGAVPGPNNGLLIIRDTVKA